ncbi:MAG: hypothetical protein WBF89_24005 [Steroidobacteraceae bacterium]|jgi:hypothetical protein
MSATASTWTGAQGELESEFEEEFETESEAEEEGEDFDLGSIGNVLGGLLGEGETTAESELEDEYESEGEWEGEDFSFGGLFKKIAPVLKSVAKIAAPVVGSAILGPAGGALGKLAASALGEGEYEGEWEEEGEYEEEDEYEGEAEAEQEIATHPLTENEAIAEMMAEAASNAASEGEAEAMAGAAAITVLSPRDRRALRKFLPSLVRGTAVLTRILRKRRSTRHAIRAVPTIMRRTARKVKRQAAAGKPVTRRSVARATAREVRRVLSRPKLHRASILRNVKSSRAVKRSRRGGRSHRAVAG